MDSGGEQVLPELGTSEETFFSGIDTSNELSSASYRILSGNLEEKKRFEELQKRYEESTEVTKPVLFRLFKPHFALLYLSVFICLGGFLYGINVSIISGALLYMTSDLSLNTPQESLVSSGMSLGGIGGAILSIPLNEKIGRKHSIMIACLFYTIGAILESASKTYGEMVAGRLILGAGVALGATTVPMYASECFPKTKRGAVITLYDVLIMFGILAGYIDSAIFVDVIGTWRYMLGSSLVFSSILFIGVILFPESPRWLMKKGRLLDAFGCWRGLQSMERAEDHDEFIRMERVVTGELESSRDRWIIVDFIRFPYCRKAAIHGTLLMFFQQFSGTNSILYFLGTIYMKAGLSRKDSIYISMIGGGTLFLSSIPAIFLIDRFGRRPLLLILTPGVVIGLIILGCAFLTSDMSGLIAMYTVGVVVYYLFWGSSLGPVPWLLNAELYPTYIRSYGMSLGTLVNFIGNWITSYAFLQMSEAMTKTGTFVGFYGGLTVIGWLYFFFLVPETKNLSLEEIRDLLSRTWTEIILENMAAPLR
eukprot:jgi/Galph1/3950/GphlegSOOS_G2634.1